MDAGLISVGFASSGWPMGWAVTPTEVLRWVLVWIISTLALAGLSGRRQRQLVIGSLLRREVTVLMYVVYIIVSVGVAYQYRELWEQWGPNVLLPFSTLLLGLTFWLPLHGARLSWSGEWDFRYPLATPDTEALE